MPMNRVGLGQTTMPTIRTSTMTRKALLLSLVIGNAFPRVVVSRSLQEDNDGNSRSNSGDYDYYNNQNYGDSNVFWDFIYRIDSDVINMWQESPSEWGNEYWEVFGGLAFLAFIVLSGLCCLFCIIPCCIPAPEGPKLLTQEEFDEKQKQLLEDQQNLANPSNPHSRSVDSGSVPQEKQSPSKSKDPILLERAGIDPGDAYITSDSEAKRQKAARTVTGNEYHLEESYTEDLFSDSSSVRGARERMDKKKAETSFFDEAKRVWRHSTKELSLSKSFDSPPASPTSEVGGGSRSRSSKAKKGGVGNTIKETVSVWKEFLGYQDEKAEKYYRKAQPKKSRRSRSKRAETPLHYSDGEVMRTELV